MRARINLWKDYYPAFALRRWWRNTRHARFPIDRTITTLCANIFNTREQNKKIYRSEIIIKWYRKRTGRVYNKSTCDSNVNTYSSCTSHVKESYVGPCLRKLCAYNATNFVRKPYPSSLNLFESLPLSLIFPFLCLFLSSRARLSCFIRVYADGASRRLYRDAEVERRLVNPGV